MDPSLPVPLRLPRTASHPTPHPAVLASIRSFLTDHSARTGSHSSSSALEAETPGSSVLASQLSRLANGLDPSANDVMAVFEQFGNLGNANASHTHAMRTDVEQQDAKQEPQGADVQMNLTQDNQTQQDETTNVQKEDQKEKKEKKQKKKKNKDE
ncbi:hypothetical protein ACQY0O_004861 [Thecaphora frezii]